MNKQIPFRAVYKDDAWKQKLTLPLRKRETSFLPSSILGKKSTLAFKFLAKTLESKAKSSKIINRIISG